MAGAAEGLLRLLARPCRAVAAAPLLVWLWHVVTACGGGSEAPPHARPCLSWCVAVDETEIAGVHGRWHEVNHSISVYLDAFSELWRCLYCPGSP